MSGLAAVRPIATKLGTITQVDPFNRNGS